MAKQKGKGFPLAIAVAREIPLAMAREMPLAVAMPLAMAVVMPFGLGVYFGSSNAFGNAFILWSSA